jgi:hypothetical protein
MRIDFRLLLLYNDIQRLSASTATETPPLLGMLDVRDI